MDPVLGIYWYDCGAFDIYKYISGVFLVKGVLYYREYRGGYNIKTMNRKISHTEPWEV